MVSDDRANLRNYASLSARAYHNHRSSDVDDRRHGDNLLAESLKLENVIVDELAALRALVAELEAAVRGLLDCRRWDHRGDAIEDVMPDAFAAADKALRATESAGCGQ